MTDLAESAPLIDVLPLAAGTPLEVYRRFYERIAACEGLQATATALRNKMAQMEAEDVKGNQDSAQDARPRHRATVHQLRQHQQTGGTVPGERDHLRKAG